MNACPASANEAARLIERADVADFLSPVADMQHGWNYNGPATNFAVSASVIQVDYDGGSTTAEPTPSGTVFTIWLRCGGST
jgi:hypothetical protein